MLDIRETQPRDHEAVWEIFHEVVIVGTLPEAFDHAREGRVDAHVMYRLL